MIHMAQKDTASPSGNRTPVSRVTGGDTHHYTNEDWLNTAMVNHGTKSGESISQLPKLVTIFYYPALTKHDDSLVMLCHRQQKACFHLEPLLPIKHVVEGSNLKQFSIMNCIGAVTYIWFLVLSKTPLCDTFRWCVWLVFPTHFPLHYPENPCVPGWARTTNLSVNSRTR